MNFARITTALKGAGLLGLLVFFVSLLTFVFSFLGTIFCAGLAGMMMGATRHARWRALPVAAVFPAVFWLVLRVGKTELLAAQVSALMVVCFASFWLTYGIALAVTFYERKARTTGQGQPDEQPGFGKRLAPAAAGETTSEACAPCSAAFPATELAGPLTLQELQGKWWHQAVAPHTPEQKELLEIEDNRLILSAIGTDGRVRRSIRGKVKVEGAKPVDTLVVSVGDGDWPADVLVSI